MRYMGFDEDGRVVGNSPEPTEEYVQVSDEVFALHQEHPEYVMYNGALVPSAERDEAIKTPEQRAAEFEAYKQGKLAGLDADMDGLLRVNGFVTSTEIKMDATLESIRKFENGIDLANRLSENEMIVVDYDNAVHVMTISQANTLLVEMGVNWRNHYVRKQTIRLNIAAAETKEAVDAAINWENI